MKYAKNLYMWMLMTLMLTGAAHAQSKTDIEYDRTMKKISQMDRVKIDTVVVTAPHSVEMTNGSYSSRTDSITMTYFLEKYDLSSVRDLGILRAKKYIWGIISHEIHHRKNHKLRQKIIFRDIHQERIFRVYHEITARIAEIITYRKQLQELQKENNGKFTFNNLLGEQITRIPSVYKTKFKGDKLYTKNLSSLHHMYGAYFTYITYVVNHPDILNTDTISGEEADYILMSALNQVYLNQSSYIPAFVSPDVLPKTQKLLHLYAELKKLNLGQNDTVFIQDFSDEFRKLGFHDASAQPTYGEVIDRLKNHPDLIPADIHQLDTIIPEMFMYNDVNLFEKFSPQAREALESHVSKYMKHTDQYANEFYTGTEEHDKTLRIMYSIYMDKLSVQQQLHAATDKVQKKSERATSGNFIPHTTQQEMN